MRIFIIAQVLSASITWLVFGYGYNDELMSALGGSGSFSLAILAVTGIFIIVDLFTTGCGRVKYLYTDHEESVNTASLHEQLVDKS